MLKLLGRRTSSNVQKVLWCLAELDQPVACEDYGGPFGKNRDPAYLRLNPNGVVPTLIDGDVALWESNTILRYLANRFGPSPLYPVEPIQRALCERWMDWQLGTLNGFITPLYLALVRTPPEARDMAATEAARAGTERLLGILDAALTQTDHLCGAQLTLADIALGMFAYRWYALPVERRAPMPHLAAWYDRLVERDGFKRHVMIGLS